MGQKYIKNISYIDVKVLKIGKPSYKNDFIKFVLMSYDLFKILRRNNFDYLITFENGSEIFIFSFFQSLFLRKKPVHIILDFIMRERGDSLVSRLKFSFLRFCYSSVKLIVCSSRYELEYYRNIFGWSDDKIIFIPLYVRSLFFENLETRNGDYIISAGKTFMDYDTFLEAVRDLPMRVILVTSRAYLNKISVPLPSNVEVRYDIPLLEYAKLLANSKFVVLPLEKRSISMGQQVLLESMALGKAIIVTDVPSIRDYTINNENALYVRPFDPNDLKSKIIMLLKDERLRSQLGANAKAFIRENCTIEHYVSNLCKFMCFS